MGDVFLRQGIQFSVTVVLARLLTPGDFGAVALISVFTGLATIFVDAGFSFALIQKQDTTDNEESSVFWVNLLAGFLLFIGISSISSKVAHYLEVPGGPWLLVLFAASILINALGAIHLAMITKRLQFKSIFKVSLIATASSGIVAIMAALHGLGVWALGLQVLVYAAVSTVLLWTYSSWRPSMVLRVASLQRLFSFGSYMFLSALLDRVNYGVQNLLIGKIYGVQELGVYNRAEATQNVPQSVVNGLISRVLFPVFSQVADDPARLRRGLGQAIRLTMLVNAPLMLGMMVTSDLVVQVVLGDQWTNAVPILEALCIWGLIWPLHVINLSVLSSLGYSKTFFNVEVIKKVLSVALLIAASRVGLLWIAWAQVAVAVIASLITMRHTKRLIGYQIISQLRDFFPPVLSAISMAVLVFVSRTRLDSSAAAELLLLVIIGAALYAILCLGARLTALREATALVSPRIAHALWKTRIGNPQ